MVLLVYPEKRKAAPKYLYVQPTGNKTSALAHRLAWTILGIIHALPLSLPEDHAPTSLMAMAATEFRLGKKYGLIHQATFSKRPTGYRRMQSPLRSAHPPEPSRIFVFPPAWRQGRAHRHC